MVIKAKCVFKLQIFKSDIPVVRTYFFHSMAPTSWFRVPEPELFRKKIKIPGSNKGDFEFQKINSLKVEKRIVVINALNCIHSAIKIHSWPQCVSCKTKWDRSFAHVLYCQKLRAKGIRLSACRKTKLFHTFFSVLIHFLLVYWPTRRHLQQSQDMPVFFFSSRKNSEKFREKLWVQ